MAFSRRLGFVPEKAVQVGSIDDALRNRLFNFFKRLMAMLDDNTWRWDLRAHEVYDYVIDGLGHISNRRMNQYELDELFTNNTAERWFLPFDVFELAIARINQALYSREFDLNQLLTSIGAEINRILEEEKSGYRLVGDIFVPITNCIELTSLQNSIQTEFSSVNSHMEKAIARYSDRTDPDYENSIKESISAVEGLCCLITDQKDATLGKALKKLKDSGLTIHKSLEQAFDKLYGYTSDENGIRHGGTDFKNAPAEDAKFMLIACSAFVNYLVEKRGKMQR